MICFSNLPTNLHLKPSYIPGGGYEVWSSEVIPNGTRFGPYEGIFSDTTEYQKSDIQWQMGEKEKMIMNVPIKRNCSWLQYVNYTFSKEQQNMIAIQHKSRMYYIAFKNIPANTELLVGQFYQIELIEDVSQRTGYRQNCIQNKGNIFEIEQNGRDRNTENYTIIRNKDEDMALRTDVPYKNVLINTSKAMTSYSNAVQTPFSVNKIYISPIKKIAMHDEQFSKRKCDEYKENSKSDLSESRDIKKTYESNLDRNKLSKFSALKFHEISYTYGELSIKHLEEQKLNHIESLALDNSQNVISLFKCEDNGKKYIESMDLSKDQKNHIHKKSYKNNISAVTCVSNTKYELYETSVMEDKPFQCNVCQKKFRDSSKLRMHLRIHTSEKPYECNVCQKKFNDSRKLKVHMRIHTGEKPYECKICQKKFTQKNHLTTHERIHTGEKPYECNICQKKFNLKNHLKIHIRIHTGEKPYECNICQNKFSKSHSLKRHKQIHSGEKPYECNVCEKKFSQKNDLKKHEYIHTGEKPYECKMCQKKFNQKRYLKRHEYVHTNEKP